jgi:hypothetical protein
MMLADLEANTTNTSNMTQLNALNSSALFNNCCIFQFMSSTIFTQPTINMSPVSETPDD